ncbi:hypothetical protein C0J52_26455 [Blattella germanica]|nr:hypothetical protein C0J52_26455 [Blattella germanica]
MPSVEPFRMDELSLSLTTGPNGYKVTLRDLDIFGASNFSVRNLKLSEEGKPFEAKIHIPELKINARYTSSGVLIILPASGQGNFHSTLSDILATVRGTITEATNLFLRENGHEVLKAMMPQLRLKLSEVFQKISNQLLSHVPTDMFLLRST